ncbi:MAG: hypothetical protein AAGF27_05675 [Pseudomonadota bacterium]
MARNADLGVSAHMVVAARLRAGFRAIEREALILRVSLWVSALSLTIASLKALHHFFDVPALSFLWQLIISICT